MPRSPTHQGHLHGHSCAVWPALRICPPSVSGYPSRSVARAQLPATVGHFVQVSVGTCPDLPLIRVTCMAIRTLFGLHSMFAPLCVSGYPSRSVARVQIPAMLVAFQTSICQGISRPPTHHRVTCTSTAKIRCAQQQCLPASQPNSQHLESVSRTANFIMTLIEGAHSSCATRPRSN